MLPLFEFIKKHTRKTRSILKGQYHIEYTFFGKFYGTVFSIEFNFPTKKEPTFAFGLTLFTCVLAWIEITKLTQAQLDSYRRHEYGEFLAD
jgi:hypothetical protein